MPEHPSPKLHAHPFRQLRDAPIAPARAAHRYAELEVTSNYTFLTGASHPEELVQRAAGLGLEALAITDTNSLAGIVRAHTAAKESGVPVIVGCRLRLVRPRGLGLLVHPTA